MQLQWLCLRHTYVVFQMYELWVRRVKQLRREMNKCLHGEKENKGNQLYKDMLYFKRNFFTPLFDFYNRLNGQNFVRFTDEEKFFRMLDETIRMFKDLVDFYSVPPEAPVSAPLTEV